MFGKKKEEKKNVNSKVLKASIAPETLNPDAFVTDARGVTEYFLKAVYAQSVPALPQRNMEDTFFYKIQQMVLNDYTYCRRNLECLDIISFEFSGYDNSMRYKVNTLSYDLAFNAKGTYTDNNLSTAFEETKAATVTFINDARKGWILCEYSEHPYVKREA